MLELRSVFKIIRDNNQSTSILTDINLKIENGEFVSLVGKSGSGKSSLLYLMGTLDKPSSGEILIQNKLIDFRSEKLIQQIRKNDLGFVFQFHYLISELTVLENVLLPAASDGDQKKYVERAKYLLNEMSLEGKLGRKPNQLSGGERQRVAIARALLKNPKLLLADEPTGNLDSINGLKIMEILKKLHEIEKTTIVLVTHEIEYSKWGQRTIHLIDGKILN
ncbi:MAG: ABC transporter ATP-binding protein [Bacteriovoracales bacterium]